jgi:hypothetical protein
MIKGITQGGRYLSVSGGTPGSNYVINYSGAQGIGNMRFNTANQNIEIWDGNSWITLNMSYATVQLDNEAISLLDWAKEQQRKQLEREALAKTHPAIANAIEAVKKAEEQLEIITILSKDHEENAKATS